MTTRQNSINRQIIDALALDFQALWLVNASDLSMEIYKSNDALAIAGSVEFAKNLTYDDARKWYTERYIVPEHRERVLEETDPKYVERKIASGLPFLVDYRRINGDTINYNQLYYAKVAPEGSRTSHFVLGFRNTDHAKLAELDDLTGLYNRRSFVNYAEKLMARNPDTEFNLVLSDFENFKQINENFGSAIGDAILKDAANFLNSIHKENLLVGRYGGDQFVCLVTVDDFEEYFMSPQTHQLKSREGLPETSIKMGICPRIKAGDSITLACDRAHIAANSIKHQYNQSLAVYSHEIKDQFDKQNMIEADMKKALKEKQFKVYYQPKHDAQTGKIVGAEALIRWIHPEFGFLSPADFIPIFEHNGFIVESDYFVYRQTCQNIRDWLDKGLPVVPISVNASKLTFDSPQIVHRINNSLSIHQVSPEYIHVEITESLMTKDTDRLIRKLSELQKQNIQIELDDFGSGFSSINVLSTLPLDVIKLDMSFMQQFGDEKRAKVLEACVSLAKNLGFKTVSEGVETKEQFESLQKIGVDVIQGYYYSKPLPAEEFEEYLKAHS